MEKRDSLMGISILFIMLFHSFVGWKWTLVTRFFVRGDIGVEFFLILSAIGLYHSLNNNGDIKQFYKRRAIRILPTYLLVAIPVYLFFARYSDDGYKNFIWDITTLSCFWGHIRYWFIHLILICYLGSPIYKKFVDSRYSTVFVPIVLAVLSTVLAGLFHNYEIIISRIPIFLLGFHLAKSLNSLEGGKCLWYPLPAILLSITILYAMSFIGWPHRWLRLLYFVVSIPMLLSFANILPYVNKGMSKFLDFLGHHTLELYLVHESICTTIVWKYYHENVYVYALLCIVMAIPLAVVVKQVSNKFCIWMGIQ